MQYAEISLLANEWRFWSFLRLKFAGDYFRRKSVPLETPCKYVSYHIYLVYIKQPWYLDEPYNMV